MIKILEICKKSFRKRITIEKDEIDYKKIVFFLLYLTYSQG